MTTFSSQPAVPPSRGSGSGNTARPEWDYTDHADAYLARPGYPRALLDRLAKRCGVSVGRGGGRILEIGAGTGNMTLDLARFGASYIAIEPNDAMRAWGQRRTAHLPVRWIAGTAERTGQADASADWIMAAQCFDTFDAGPALKELRRVLDPAHGSLTVLWNHRVWDDDPTEAAVEELIAKRLGGYSRGVRRKDPTPALRDLGGFPTILADEETHTVPMDVDRYVQVWRSVRTLAVQAGPRFEPLLDEIRTLLQARGVVQLDVKYVTRSWTAHVAG
jgi:SAM-dependent methyltransferase